MIAAGHGTLKIDLMKPVLYEETFIRSVEYITTITIIMPKSSSSSSSSFPHFHCICPRQMQWGTLSLFITMILSRAPSPLKVPQLDLWAKNHLLKLDGSGCFSSSSVMASKSRWGLQTLTRQDHLTYWCVAMLSWHCSMLLFIVFNWFVDV